MSITRNPNKASKIKHGLEGSMEREYWLVIDTLADCVEHGVDTEKLKKASFELHRELDRRLVDNLPVEEVKRLVAALERLNYGV